MNLKFQKLSNQYFFISNLSNWHFSCNPEYNKVWLKETGELFKEEKKVLRQLIPIFQKYEFDYENPKNYLGTHFVNPNEKDIWNNISSIITKDELRVLKQAFIIFDRKFNLVWEKNKNFGFSIIKKVENEFKKNNFSDVLNKIKILFNQETSESTIHLLLTPPNKNFIGGGANTGNWQFTLELGDGKNITEGILVILHELCHQLIRNLDLDFKIKDIDLQKKLSQITLFKEQGLEEGLEELTICSLLPDGFLSKDITDYFSEIKEKEYNDLKSYEDLENYVILKSKDFILDYTENKKQLDQNYINNIINIIKSFLSTI